MNILLSIYSLSIGSRVHAQLSDVVQYPSIQVVPLCVTYTILRTILTLPFCLACWMSITWISSGYLKYLRNGTKTICPPGCLLFVSDCTTTNWPIRTPEIKTCQSYYHSVLFNSINADSLIDNEATTARDGHHKQQHVRIIVDDGSTFLCLLYERGACFDAEDT